MKLNEALLQSHSQLRQISDDLLSVDNAKQQSIYFEQLWQQFLVHEHAEEYIAFHIMQEKVDKNTHFTDKNLEFAVNEHHYFEEFVEHIALMPEEFEVRDKLIEELVEQLDSHMRHEEAYIFPRFAEQLDDEQNQQMVVIYIDKCREFNRKYNQSAQQSA